MKDRGDSCCRRIFSGSMLFMPLFLTGCSLALPETKSADAMTQDRLAGVVVTEGYIDMGMPELVINNRGDVSFEETEKRIYGTFDETSEGNNVTFEGVEGAGLYTLQIWDEANEMYTGYSLVEGSFSDVKVSAVDGGDVMEATLYVNSAGSVQYYFNPVYQTPEGEIYLLPGSGISSDSLSEGASMSQKLTAETTVTENGEEEKVFSSFEVHITGAAEPESTEILFFDEENKIIGGANKELCETFLASEEIPELSVPAKAAYLMLVQDFGESAANNTARTIYSRGEDGMELRGRAEKGILQNRWLRLLWE